MITDAGIARSKSDSIDIDIDVIAGAKNNDDDLDLSITSSGRTIEKIIEEQASNTSQRNKSPNGNRLPTGVPAVTATISNPLTIPTKKSAARAIPLPNSTQSFNSSTLGIVASHPGSQDSSGSAFLSGILNLLLQPLNNSCPIHHLTPSERPMKILTLESVNDQV